MKKIFKILSIFVMVFVLFSCANPSSDSTSGSQPSGSKTPVETPSDDTEPSGPETPVETPSDDTEPSGPETPVETPSDDPEPSGPETPVETPSDDPEPSGPETPVETPTEDPVEETPEVPTYSITFTTEDSAIQVIIDYLNTLPEFKNLKEGTEVMLYKHLYSNEACTEFTKEIVENSTLNHFLCYNSNPGIDSVVIRNEDVEVEVIYKDWSRLE